MRLTTQINSLDDVDAAAVDASHNSAVLSTIRQTDCMANVQDRVMRNIRRVAAAAVTRRVHSEPFYIYAYAAAAALAQCSKYAHLI